MKINEKEVKREWKKLLGDFYNVGYYDPVPDYFNECGWNVILSDRSRGKTTNPLLLGMLLHKKYGIIPHYVRRREKEDLAPKNLKDLFKTIREFKYIEKLTDNKYNDVMYHGRRWYYIHRNEDGEIDNKAPEHFMMCMGIDCADNYKSSYNCPTGDLIILDEFIPLKISSYLPDEFIMFVDICKTVFRDRSNCKVFCISNSIDRYSPYFREFGCSKEVQKMNAGDSLIHTTDIGTKVKIHFMSASLSKQRQIQNVKLFGFDNPKLGMLNSSQWQMKMYPHPMFRVRDTELLNGNIYMLHNENLIQMELRTSPDIGAFVVCHPVTISLDDLKDNYIVYTLDTSKYNIHFKHSLGANRFDLRFWKLYKMNKFFYSDNDTGALVEHYINSCRIS